MFLGLLQDPDNACKIGFEHKILAKIFIFNTEDNVPVGRSKKKIWKKFNFFCHLKVTEEKRSDPDPLVRVAGSRPKCDGSLTLPECACAPSALAGTDPRYE
jgi:hypothetical protein